MNVLNIDLNTYALVLLQGEEIINSLTKFARTHNVSSGRIFGIGAVKDVELGFFNQDKREYVIKKLNGEAALLSLQGNFSLKEGEIFPHCHVLLGDEEFHGIGGHLFRASISVTGEFHIVSYPESITRKFDPGVNLFLWDLGE
jgi:predicted DNA-binding protein with PD1-like motif